MTTTNLDDLPEKSPFPGWRGKFIRSENMTFVYWDVPAGTVLPEHSHPHEQVAHSFEGEFEIMKAHTTIGARILAGGRTPVVRMAESIALNHHERWNGTGYPNGLQGEAIPLEARVVSVADVYDALSHARPYRGAWSLEDTRREIERGSGTLFDPTLVATFLTLPAGSFPD